MTVADYDAMIMAQNGVCAICHKPETYKQYGKIRHLVVDHDHTTGKVRGLLCHGCNIAIAALKESPEAARSAAEYLELHKGKDANAVPG